MPLSRTLNAQALPLVHRWPACTLPSPSHNAACLAAGTACSYPVNSSVQIHGSVIVRTLQHSLDRWRPCWRFHANIVTSYQQCHSRCLLLDNHLDTASIKGRATRSASVSPKECNPRHPVWCRVHGPWATATGLQASAVPQRRCTCGRRS